MASDDEALKHDFGRQLRHQSTSRRRPIMHLERQKHFSNVAEGGVTAGFHAMHGVAGTDCSSSSRGR